jgi:hypothetical protein
LPNNPSHHKIIKEIDLNQAEYHNLWAKNQKKSINPQK